jgi:hypothetical protein
VSFEIIDFDDDGAGTHLYVCMTFICYFISHTAQFFSNAESRVSPVLKIEKKRVQKLQNVAK